MANDQIIIYQTSYGQTAIDVKLSEDNISLNQYQLANLFYTDRTSLVKHIKNIYRSGETSEDTTCAKFAQVQNEGLRNQQLKFVLSIRHLRKARNVFKHLKSINRQ